MLYVQYRLGRSLINFTEYRPSWVANSHSVKKFPAFHGTQRFITMLTRAPLDRSPSNKYFPQIGLEPNSLWM